MENQTASNSLKEDTSPIYRNSFVQIPRTVLMDTRLTPAEKIVYAALLSFDFANKEGIRKGLVWSGIKKLKERSVLSERTIIKSLNTLGKLNYIKKIRLGKKCTNRYYILPIPRTSEPQDLQFTDVGFAPTSAEMS